MLQHSVQWLFLCRLLNWIHVDYRSRYRSWLCCIFVLCRKFCAVVAVCGKIVLGNWNLHAYNRLLTILGFCVLCFCEGQTYCSVIMCLCAFCLKRQMTYSTVSGGTLNSPHSLTPVICGIRWPLLKFTNLVIPAKSAHTSTLALVWTMLEVIIWYVGLVWFVFAACYEVLYDFVEDVSYITAA